MTKMSCTIEQHPDKSLEIISVRLYDTNEKDEKIRHSVEQVIGQMPPDFSVTLYYNPIIQGEWAFHIVRPKPQNPEEKSNSGLCLAEILRRVGVVNHSLLCPHLFDKNESGE